MRDYGVEDKRTMASDLLEIQKLWQTILDKVDSEKAINGVPNFVFVLQKELAMSEEGMVTHFFLGKARIIEISPFSPDELVDYYKKEFGAIYPFKDESDLAMLARLSRGIFRLYLRYIKLSLEAYIQQQEQKEEDSLSQSKVTSALDAKRDDKQESPEYALANVISIDSELIAKILGDEEIYFDWQMDLRRIFSGNSRQAKAAAEIIRILMEVGESVPQSLIAKYLSKKKEEYKISRPEASRILSKLEQYGYVRRKREGTEKLVELNF
jgi:DNA-binding transcriptional ArsR family regulator